MKKSICIILICVLLLGLSLAFVGCNNNDSKAETKYYNVTFKRASGISSGTTMSFEEGKPMGNNFRLWSKQASYYTFYTDKSCATMWNMSTDKVYCDMTLYVVG